MSSLLSWWSWLPPSARPRASMGGLKVAVAAEGAGQDALVAALTELCEALPFCAEDAGDTFPTEAVARALVWRADVDGAEASPDMVLLCLCARHHVPLRRHAARRASDAAVRHGLLPLLWSRLLAIEYLDVAEQCLQAFEKISRRQPQAGMITAVLTYIDFFTASIQGCNVCFRKCLQKGPRRLLLFFCGFSPNTL